MSDNLRVYRAIRGALHQLHPSAKGDFARHLTTLAMFVTGIVQSQKSQLPAVAGKVPDRSHPHSRVKRLSRWLQNRRITAEAFFLPVAKALLLSLPDPLCLVIDSSEVGDGCRAWMVSVIYKKRALPLVWSVKAVKKGHASDLEHLQLLKTVKDLLPPDRRVIVLGDGEFDGVPVLTALSEWKWEYVLRTAKNRLLEYDGSRLRFEALAPALGKTVCRENVRFTREGFGPLLAGATWPAGRSEVVYWVSNMTLAETACFWYRKRFVIETLFSDQKSRGFHLHKSHLSDPERLFRLMIGVCLAYLWVVFLGVKAKREGWQEKLHRKSRCDWSLFRLGLALLDELLNQCLEIPIFRSPFPTHALKSVR